MTGATMPVGPLSVFGTTLDRGVSDDADRLRSISRQPSIVSWSTTDERRAQLLTSLHSAYVEAVAGDWDGEGSAPASPLSLSQTAAFLLSLPPSTRSPEITVDPDGEFSLEWDYGRRAVFSVSVGRDGTLSYAGLFGVSKSHGVEPFTGIVPEIVTINIQRAISQGEIAR